MWLFLAGIAMLIVGYFTYGRFLDRVLEPDDREPPSRALADGVDYVELPRWKNFLIQLLNIAGVGPVIGVVLGIKFGWIVFLIIPIGNIFGGAVHDFVAGFYSMRKGGESLPSLTSDTLGKLYSRTFTTGMMLFLLLLVVAVFINIPAQLIDSLLPGLHVFWWAVGVIFLYYVVATLFPVDKIIGSLYPFFGALLLVGTAAIFCSLVWHVWQEPTLLTETEAFKAGKFQDQPIIPCLFVTIACGILSGFHATQSPIVARTMTHERQARSVFYGSMIMEGIIGMIWAGAGMAIYNLEPELMQQPPMIAIKRIAELFLGSWMGMAVVFGVIVLAITSGDTALRSLRLSVAERLKVPQRKFASRLLLCLPLITLVSGLLWWSNKSTQSFENLWKYFAWANQVLAASTLMMCTVWMMHRKKSPLYTLLPGMFMTFVVSTYILWTSPAHNGPYGFGIPLPWSYAIAGAFTLFVTAVVIRIGRGKPRASEGLGI